MSSVRLFTLDGAQRRHPDVVAWFASPPAALRSLAERWFDVMRACGSDVRELLHDGHPTACVGNVAFGYVNAFKDHVNVGFFVGTSLPDAAGLLEGTGRFMRHTKVRPGAALDEAALRELSTGAYHVVRAELIKRGEEK
jgi:hypothetical protein